MNAVRAGLPLAALLAALAMPAPAGAQFVDYEVGVTPASHMRTVLQKTFLKVDVLSVDICFDVPTAGRMAATAARGRLRGAAADAITRAALDGDLAVARVAFLRDIPLGDFLDGIDQDLRNAVAGGLVPDSVYRVLAAGLPVWFAPLDRRGLRKGDVLVYEMQPEAVRTIHVSREGKVLLDRTESGRALRNSPLAAWLAPGSPFRAGLLESLQRGSGRDAGRR
ncbi:MAG TPA: hypothetical protein VK939_08830, partial [Longimicrobiales bacterium]|nr:hypothetical protein [Longimicrobiales bacterium]